MKSLLCYVVFALALISPEYAAADNKAEFIRICEKPDREQLITVKQIANNVNLKYKSTLCGTIYAQIQKKKSFFDSGDYLLTLSPLYFADNLETIYLSFDRSITQIDFSEIKHLRKLKTLSIRGTHPTAFYNNTLPNIVGAESFSHLTNLQVLTLHNLGITNIDFLGDFKNIDNVEISKNKITHLNSNFLPTSLRILNLNNNHIAELPDLSHLTILENLDISHNSFNDISNLGGIQSLKDLNLSRAVLSKGRLDGIDVISTFSKLERLHIPGWNIENLEFLNNLKRIEEIHLQNNNVSDITQLTKLTSLKSLDLTRNNVSDLSPLIPMVTNNNLNLSGSSNPLRSCSPKTVDQIKLGIHCNDSFFSNTWCSIRRLFM